MRTNPSVYSNEKIEGRSQLVLVLVSCSIILATVIVVVLAIICSSSHRTLFQTSLSGTEKKNEQKK